MRTYGINTEEFLDGHCHISKKEMENYKFEDFLQEFEGDVCALTVVEAWNKLAKKYKWDDHLQAINKYSKKPIEG